MQPTEGEKIFTHPTPKRGLIPKVHKELKKLDTNKPKNTKKGGEKPFRYSQNPSYSSQKTDYSLLCFFRLLCISPNHSFQIG